MSVTVRDVRFSFVMSGQQFHEDFCLSERETPSFVDDVPVIGLLGNIFLQQQNLVVDYDEFSLHTSEVSHENLTTSDCDFFFPMEIGLKNYGIPIVSLFQNEKEIPMMADSGASGNMIAKQTIADCCMDHKLLDETDTISGIGGSIDTRLAIANFSLLTLKGNMKMVNSYHLSKVPSHVALWRERSGFLILGRRSSISGKRKTVLKRLYEEYSFPQGLWYKKIWWINK